MSLKSPTQSHEDEDEDEDDDNKEKVGREGIDENKKN